MVVTEGDIGRLLAVECTIALHLVLVAARIAVKEVAVVHPHVAVVLLEPDVIAFIAIHVHDSEVTDFHVLRILDADAPAVRGRIGTDALDGHQHAFLLVHVHQDIALVRGIRVRDVAHQAEIERTFLEALLDGGKDRLEAGTVRRSALVVCRDVELDRVLRRFADVDNDGAVLERAVHLVGAGDVIVAERKSRAVVRLHRKRLRRSGRSLLAALHSRDLQRVVTRLEARHVHTPGGAVLADKLGIDLHVGLARTAIVNVVAVGAVVGPLRIRGFEPAPGRHQGNFGIGPGREAEP